MSFIRISGSSENLAVSKILCVGANYLDHIAEMNPDKPPTPPSEPVIFLKPPSAILHHGGTIRKPAGVGEMHHEVELIVAIGKPGRNISEGAAADHILAYGIGLDLTLRDMQAAAKKAGRPWAIAKGFDTSAVISELIPAKSVVDPYNLELLLEVNGAIRQHGSTSGMIFKVPAIVAYLSRFFTLEKGDVVFTGTPPGVGPLNRGDRVRARLGTIAEVEVVVGDA